MLKMDISLTWLAQETLDSAISTGRAERKQLLWSRKQKTSVSEVYWEAMGTQGHGTLHVLGVRSNLLLQVREFGAYQGLIVTRWSETLTGHLVWHQEKSWFLLDCCSKEGADPEGHSWFDSKSCPYQTTGNDCEEWDCRLKQQNFFHTHWVLPEELRQLEVVWNVSPAPDTSSLSLIVLMFDFDGFNDKMESSVLTFQL